MLLCEPHTKSYLGEGNVQRNSDGKPPQMSLLRGSMESMVGNSPSRSTRRSCLYVSTGQVPIIVETDSVPKLSWIGAWVYVLCGSFAKISLLTVYLRLSPFGWFRTCTITTLVIVVCQTIVLMFCAVLFCIPVEKIWDINYPSWKGRCFDLFALYMAMTIANIITDAILLILPIPLIMGLNMPDMKKPPVLVVFIFASACVAPTSFSITSDAKYMYTYTYLVDPGLKKLTALPC